MSILLFDILRTSFRYSILIFSSEYRHFIDFIFTTDFFRYQQQGFRGHQKPIIFDECPSILHIAYIDYDINLDACLSESSSLDMTPSKTQLR